MCVFLSRYGIYLSKITVYKYRNKVLNLSAIIMCKKQGYTSDKKHKIFNNLVKQDFTVDKKNKIWYTDFAYMCQTNGRFRYNCSIINLFDKSAVACVNDDYINTKLAIKTLPKALEQENYLEGLILHSDQVVRLLYRILLFLQKIWNNPEYEQSRLSL